MRYEGDIYRPPSEARSLIVQVTVGCAHNTCTFCTMYKAKQFRIRPQAEVLVDLAGAAEAYGPLVRKIFLADGDALIVPADRLLEILDFCRERFPALERVTAYATAQDILRKTDEELAALNAQLEGNNDDKELAELNAQMRAGNAQSRDDEELAALKGDLARGGVPSLIGFCRNEQDVPGEIAAALLMLIERPFSVSLLRQYMTQWSGYTVFSSQNEDRAANAYPGVVPVSGRAIPLAMEDEATLRCGDARISLTAKEAALMRCLLDHRGEIVGRDALDEALHSAGRESADSNKTEVYLCFLRRKIERPLGIRLITTVRGKGYRLE